VPAQYVWSLRPSGRGFDQCRPSVRAFARDYREGTQLVPRSRTPYSPSMLDAIERAAATVNAKVLT